MPVQKLLRIPAATLVTLLGLLLLVSAQQSDQPLAAGWPSYAHDSHHTALSAVASQPLTKIHWNLTIDDDPPNNTFIHYGSPLVTPANTTIVPMKHSFSTYSVEAHNTSTGALLWKQGSDYIPASASFVPGFYPVLDHGFLIIPAGGGTILVRSNPDQATGTLRRLAFYGLDNFNANPQAYINNVQISTPITADAKGNLYFGFVVNGPTPINLKSGLARIGTDRKGTWIVAANATDDSGIRQVNTSCGPALSMDGSTVYVGLNNPDFGYGDLVAFDSTTLATKSFARLKDPSSGLDAIIFDASSASPTVGPDGDVYYGVLENPFPDHNDRGWLAHFDATLKHSKVPGSFGWDNTVSIVDPKMVTSYHGTSKYLLMTKYNNYAGIGTGDGQNKIAILDPFDTEQDPVLPNTTVMKEVITILGQTPDSAIRAQFPQAVREWCINTAAVDPKTKTVLANSEDGKLYRWDLTTNTFSEKITLTRGVGEAYTPTVIGADGTAYAINDSILFAIGK